MQLRAKIEFRLTAPWRLLLALLLVLHNTALPAAASPLSGIDAGGDATNLALQSWSLDRPADAAAAIRLAQSDDVAQQSRPSSSRPSGNAPAGDKKVTPAPAPTCFDVRVTVDDRKRNGSVWDIGGATVRQPDPRIAEMTTGASIRCKDTHTCALRVTGRGPFYFVLTDMDLSNHDPIGEGECLAGRSCRLGSASLSMSAC